MTKRKEAEDRSTELELKLVGLQELLVTLKDVKGAEKVLLFSLYSVLFYHETSIRLGSYDGFLRRHMWSQTFEIKGSKLVLFGLYRLVGFTFSRDQSFMIRVWI